MTTYEEWRVTGTWPEDGKPFEIAWRSDRCQIEAAVQTWVAWARNAKGVTDGPHLHKRTVTVSDWTEVDT